MKTSVILSLVLLVGLLGCHGSLTQQALETNDPLIIAKASYADARIWYNEAQESFLRYAKDYSESDKIFYNELLDKMGEVLNRWGQALKLKDLLTTNPEEFRTVRNDLIDAGFKLLITGD